MFLDLEERERNESQAWDLCQLTFLHLHGTQEFLRLKLGMFGVTQDELTDGHPLPGTGQTLLALCSEITPGGDQGIICSARNQVWVGCILGKHVTPLDFFSDSE